MKRIIGLVLMLALAFSVSALEITSPEDKTYTTTAIALNMTHSEELDNISYAIDGSTETLACENCSGYTAALNLSEGEHTITATGIKGNESFNDSVSFEIELPEETPEFSLKIESPKNKEYDESEIEISVKSNETLDRLNVYIENKYNESCENCSSFEDTLNLSEGNYVLVAKAFLGDEEKERSVHFSIDFDEEENETDDENETSPRFTIGFEKLPQIVKAGNISDEDLAEILENNQLNPGIINRLIKTGKLGNESLSAILDYQTFKAEGIWNKFLLLFNYKGNTYAAQIANIYKLPEKLEEKLVTRDDLPKGLSKKIEAKLQERIKDNEDSDDNKTKENKTKTLEVGKQDKIPPGQEKKMNGVSDNTEKENNTPPGQQKRSN